MKRIIAILLLSLASSAYALPNCPSDESVRWHNCFGTYTSNGEKYVGTWEKNKYHGQGTYTHSNGDKYVGTWKGDFYHGQGTLTYSDGDKYVGAYKEGRQHGQGIYSFTNGDVDEGEWVRDERHGTFSLTRAGTSDKNVFSKGQYVGKGDDGLKILNNRCSTKRDTEISHSRHTYQVLRGVKNWNIIGPLATQNLKTEISNIEYNYKKCIR
jgi:hypothetical protein